MNENKPTPDAILQAIARVAEGTPLRAQAEAALATLCAERDAIKAILLSLAPDGWYQSGTYECCVADCGNEPEQGHAPDCKYVAALQGAPEAEE